MIKRIRAWLTKTPLNYYDFEARCVKCHKRIRILLTRKDDGIFLKPEKCSIHPDDSIILWPFRPDLVDLDTGTCEPPKGTLLRIIK